LGGFPGHPGKIVHESPISIKITRAKWTRGMAQAIYHLYCKCKALVPPKRKKKEPSIMANICNFSIQEPEAGDFEFFETSMG
jgi:hypothetical protein